MLSTLALCDISAFQLRGGDPMQKKPDSAKTKKPKKSKKNTTKKPKK
jgi:hypothetical protein